MTIQDFNIQSRAFDILEAKKNSENPEKFFDEAADNSLQYGAANITVQINEQSNMVSVRDDGQGFTNLKAFKAFHQPYHRPVQFGISHYGIGGKIFKTLSDKRIVYSISDSDENMSQKKVYFSLWDTSTPESTDTPEVFCFVLGERPAGRITDILEQYGLLDQFIEDLETSETGTFVCLVDINSERVINFFRNWSRMYSKVKDSFFERYHLLIDERDTNITVTYINNKGIQNEPCLIGGFDPRSNFDKKMTGKRPFVKTIGSTQIHSWIKKTSVSRLKNRGIHFYRDGIKIATIPFVKLHGNNVNDFVDLDVNKRGYRMNHESQMIMMRSNSDDSFNLGETKDKIRLPVKIGVAAAKEMQVIISITDSARKDKLAERAKKSNSSVKISIPSAQIELETPQSFLKTPKGIEIIYGSVLHEKLAAADSVAKDLFIELLGCFDTIYHEKSSNEKASMTRLLNRAGQLLETKL